MSSANRDSFLSPFPICIPFTYFCCLITLARLSSVMLSGGVAADSRHTYLVLSLTGRVRALSVILSGLLFVCF